MSFNFFSIQQTPNRFLKTTTAFYPTAVPTGGSGTIDVYGDFRWKNTGSIDEVPQILLSEFKLNTGARTANLLELWGEMTSNLSKSNTSSVGNFVSSAGGIAKEALARTVFGDPYEGLYKGEPTGFYYNLPYIKNGSIRGDGMKNNWANDETIFDMLGKAFPALKSVGNAMGSLAAQLKDEAWGAEDIKKFTGSNARTVTIQFPLYNTYSIKEANDNFSFISLFGFQNLRTRTSYMTFLPPKVYTVDTLDEGGIYMPIAVVTDFKVENMGTLRRMTDFGTSISGPSATGYRLVPEAYKVTITLTELIPETTNIMQGALGHGKVQVINNSLGSNMGNVDLNNISSSGLFDFLDGSSAGTLGASTADNLSPTQEFNQNNSWSTSDSLTSPEVLSSTGMTDLDKIKLVEYQQEIQQEKTFADMQLNSTPMSEEQTAAVEAYRPSPVEQLPGMKTSYQLPGMEIPEVVSPVYERELIPGMDFNAPEESNVKPELTVPVIEERAPQYTPEAPIEENRIQINTPVTLQDSSLEEYTAPQTKEFLGGGLNVDYESSSLSFQPPALITNTDTTKPSIVLDTQKSFSTVAGDVTIPRGELDMEAFNLAVRMRSESGKNVTFLPDNNGGYTVVSVDKNGVATPFNVLDALPSGQTVGELINLAPTKKDAVIIKKELLAGRPQYAGNQGNQPSPTSL